jgi:hypothetical protein
MPTIVATTVVTFDAIEVAVFVTTFCTPPMSFERLHLAGARVREERERQALQVTEDFCAQVVHHALADLVRQQRLDHAEHAGDDRDRNHPCGGEGQRRRVVVPDRLQRSLEQEGGEDTEPCGDDDQQQDCAEASAVRHEQRADAAHVGAPLRRVGRPLGRLVGCMPERAQLFL